MQIAHVGIHNFRSIRDISFEAKDLMVFIGPNNHGKSNILGGIEFALSTSAKLGTDDFFCHRDEEKNEVRCDELWVELTFSQLNEQEKNTFAKYIRNDGSIKVRKYAQLLNDGKIDSGYHGYLEEPEEWWLRSDAFGRLNTQAKVQEEGEGIPILLQLLETGGRILKERVEEFQRSYIETHMDELVFREYLEDTPFMGTKNVAGGLLPDFYLVPAVRDVSDEAKFKSSTVFGRLLQRAVSEMTKRDERFADIRNRLEDLISEINQRPDVEETEKTDIALLEGRISAELKMWGVDVSIKVTPPEVEKIFELGTQLYLDDGLETQVERKGHGLQRAVIFALLRAWAGTLRAAKEKDDETDVVARRASDSVIFAIEEPELYLHPHAQRQLANDLNEIASAADHQVLICSHSTYFVNLEKYQSIAIVAKNNANDGTTLKQCTKELFEGEDADEKKGRFHMAYWINPDRSEMFFGRKVILVEGETEKSLFPFLAKQLGVSDPTVSLIDCGSKHNLPLYITILNAFGLTYTVVHDEDPLPDPIPDDWGEEKRREKRRTFELNTIISNLVDNRFGNVYMVSPDIEGASGVSKTQGKKMGKAIAALEHFALIAPNEISESVRNIVTAAFR